MGGGYIFELGQAFSIHKEDFSFMDSRSTNYFQYKSVLVDCSSRQIFCCGQEIKMTKLHFNLLVHFMNNPNRVCSYDELLENVWGFEQFNDDWHVVRLAVSRLRQALESCPSCSGIAQALHTIHSIGYRFDKKP